MSSICNGSINLNSKFSEPLAESFGAKDLSRGYKGSKTRYSHIDPRKEIKDIGNADIKKQAKSVACIVDKTCLKQHNSFYKLEADSLAVDIQRSYRSPLSKGEKFADQITPGFGTAFLVSDRLLLTAAHCVCKENSNDLDPLTIANKRFIFDFQISEGGDCKINYMEDEIYRIKKVVAHKFSRREIFSDYAVVELDRPVTGREPLKVKCSKVADAAKLYVIGHSCGLPMKYTDDGEVRINKDEHSFETDSSTFQGNSGSPIFEADTGAVVGILAAGNKDFEKIELSNGLFEVITHRATQKEVEKDGYEVCQRMSDLSFIEKL